LRYQPLPIALADTLVYGMEFADSWQIWALTTKGNALTDFNAKTLKTPPYLAFGFAWMMPDQETICYSLDTETVLNNPELADYANTFTQAAKACLQL